ncbi:hypothetical protein Tco_0459901, partial [Tanacetum coccineum]
MCKAIIMGIEVDNELEESIKMEDENVSIGGRCHSILESFAVNSSLVMESSGKKASWFNGEGLLLLKIQWSRLYTGGNGKIDEISGKGANSMLDKYIKRLVAEEKDIREEAGITQVEMLAKGDLKTRWIRLGSQQSETPSLG